MPRKCKIGGRPVRLMACAAGMAAMACGHACEFFYMDHDVFTGGYVGAVGSLVLSGELVSGDYERLLTKIAADPQRFLHDDRLILSSTEGDAAEAMKIAGLLQALHADVNVGPLTGRCAGACFLIYAAADRRVTDGERLLGVHAPLDAAELTFLRGSEVPEELLEAMPVERNGGSVHWLTEGEEIALKTTSPAFHRYLAAKCAWDDGVEAAVKSGKRPLSDMRALWACRTRVTRQDARKALAVALKAAPMAH